MNDLSSNIFYKIFLNFTITEYYIDLDIYNFEYVNKYIFNIFKELKLLDKINLYNQIIKKYKYIEKIFPSFIFNSINDKSNNLDLTNFKYLINAKNVSLENKTGITSYIDFITKKYFIDTNIIYGYDCFNRFFISLLYDNESKKNNIITFFQRYSDDKYLYVNCMNTFLNIITTHYFLNENIIDLQFRIFCDLIKFGESKKTYVNDYQIDNFNFKLSLIDN